MFSDILVSALLLTFVHATNPASHAMSAARNVIASKEISLNDRYGNSFVNNVFKDNILLNIAYLKGKINPNSIDWDEIEKPFHYEMKLNTNEIFAFHDAVLPQFQGKIAKTTNAHFNYAEGFKSDGYLSGDGICHLASLMNWTAKEAGLDVKAPTPHDFAVIPEIPREFGVSIYSHPQNHQGSALQNLYIKNNLKKSIVFAFDYNGQSLKLAILE